MSVAKRKRTQTCASTPCAQYETQFKPTGGAFLVDSLPNSGRGDDSKHEDTESCPLHHKLRLSGDHLLLVGVVSPEPKSSRFWQKIHVDSDYNIRVIKSSRKRDSLPGTLLFFESAEQRQSFQLKFKGDTQRMCNDVVVTWMSKFHSYRYHLTNMPTRPEPLVSTDDVEESLQKLLSFSGQQPPSHAPSASASLPSSSPSSSQSQHLLVSSAGTGAAQLLAAALVLPSEQAHLAFLKLEPNFSSPPGSVSTASGHLSSAATPQRAGAAAAAAATGAAMTPFTHPSVGSSTISSTHSTPSPPFRPNHTYSASRNSVASNALNSSVLSASDSVFDSDLSGHWPTDALNPSFGPTSPLPSYAGLSSPLHPSFVSMTDHTSHPFGDPRLHTPPIPSSLSMGTASPGYDVLNAAHPLNITDSGVPPDLTGLPLSHAFDALSVGSHHPHSNGVAPMQISHSSAPAAAAAPAPFVAAVSSLPDWLLATLRQALPAVSQAMEYSHMPAPSVAGLSAATQLRASMTGSGCARADCAECEAAKLSGHSSTVPPLSPRPSPFAATNGSLSRAGTSSSVRVKPEPVLVPLNSSSARRASAGGSFVDSAPVSIGADPFSGAASASMGTAGHGPFPSAYVYQDVQPPSRHQPHVTHIHNYFFILNGPHGDHPPPPPPAP